MKKITSLALALLMAAFLSSCAGRDDNVTAGMNYISAEKYTEALASFNEAERVGENKRLILRGRGIAYIGLHDYENAINNLTECLSLSDGFVKDIDIDTNYYLAGAFLKNNQPEEAVSVYDAILYFKENDKDTLFLRGSALLAANRPADALEDFETLKKLEPTNYERSVEIFKVLDSYDYTTYGKEFLDAAVEAGVGKMSDYELGMIYYYLKDYKQAYDYLERARRDGTREACYYLGRSYEATGDYNYALSVYENYINTVEEDALIYNQIGLCRMKTEDYEGALAAFQSGMQLDNELKAELAFNEIVAYEYIGDFKNAKVLMEDYISQYPDDKNAQHEYEFLKTR